jgi:hypothetical protein
MAVFFKLSHFTPAPVILPTSQHQDLKVNIASQYNNPLCYSNTFVTYSWVVQLQATCGYWAFFFCSLNPNTKNRFHNRDTWEEGACWYDMEVGMK